MNFQHYPANINENIIIRYKPLMDTFLEHKSQQPKAVRQKMHRNVTPSCPPFLSIAFALSTARNQSGIIVRE